MEQIGLTDPRVQHAPEDARHTAADEPVGHWLRSVERGGTGAISGGAIGAMVLLGFAANSIALGIGVALLLPGVISMVGALLFILIGLAHRARKEKPNGDPPSGEASA